MKEIVIDYRFRGPPRSGNGGYVCGMLAKTLDDVVEVTLLKPVPLNVSLKIIRSDDGGATLAQAPSSTQAETATLTLPDAIDLPARVRRQVRLAQAFDIRSRGERARRRPFLTK